MQYMRATPLILSLLTLQSVSSADELPSFKTLANELQHKILVSNSVDFCEYVRSVAEGVITPASPEVENFMLAKAAEEERHLGLNDETQRVRKKQILRSVRTLVRLHSTLLIVCKATDIDKLEHLAELFESTFQYFSSFSESPTWKKACMAGLFGRNALSKLFPHLSETFRSRNEVLLLQTAFFIGDTDSLKAIIKLFGMLKEDVPNMVSERDIVFSNSGIFFKELFRLLPNVMEKRLMLIRIACDLNCLGSLLGILEVAKSVELERLDWALDSFENLKLYKRIDNFRQSIECRLLNILLVAAQHGHLPIIRFLWLTMEAMPNSAEVVVKGMMTKAGWNDQRSVLEFLLWASGTECMRLARKFVNDAFEVAIGGGHVKSMELLTGKDNDGQFIAPRLDQIELSWVTLSQAIIVNKNWSGIQYLVDLKTKGDPRFANFELVDRANTALCYACKAGDYDLVEYLLCRTDDGEFVLPFTNPAAQDNKPLSCACSGGHWRIIQKLLGRDESGDYIYKGIDPSRGIFDACNNDNSRVLEFLFRVNEGGEYIFPGMTGVNFTRLLSIAITGKKMETVQFLLKIRDGKYVVPGMNGVDFIEVLSSAISWKRMGMVRFLLTMKEGKYVLPGIRVTEDMLTTVDPSPEMTNLLEKRLGQQRIDVEKHVMWFISTK